MMYLKLLINLIKNLFFPHREEGELTVCSKGEVSLPFKRRHRFKVFFLDEPNLHPCDPGQEDSIFFTRAGKELVIRYEVSSCRKIGWQAL